jgi:hypothetical protein
MTTPRIPDFETLWSTPDDETATEWLRLVDSFTGGLFIEPGEHTEDAPTPPSASSTSAPGWR